LDNREVQESSGRFTRDQIDTIWNEPEYADMRDELLQLMTCFKLCYQIPGSDSEFIAPQLLDDTQPPYAWDESHNLLLRYRYGFMPKGIITRLIVEMYSLIENQNLLWKSGMVLNNGSARAEVIEHFHNSEIHIRVSGTRRRNFLSVISYQIDIINATYERLTSTKLIPCSCSSCNGSQSPFFYSAEVLSRFIDKNKHEIQCQESFEMVSIRSLISEVYSNDAIDQSGDFTHGIDELHESSQSQIKNLPIYFDYKKTTDCIANRRTRLFVSCRSQNFNLGRAWGWKDHLI
jgi:internalin A